MKILIIGPTDANGSLTPYTKGLLREYKELGHVATLVGSDTLPFDEKSKTFWPFERVRDDVIKLLSSVDLDEYDVVSLHFGKIDIEQLVPVMLEGRVGPKIVYHVHSINWDLFDEFIPMADVSSRVTHEALNLDGYIFFGEYGRRQLAPHIPSTAPSTVLAYPSTFTPSNVDVTHERAGKQNKGLMASLFGFNSPWKDINSLFKAFKKVDVPLNFVLAGPHWHDAVDFKSRRIGNVSVSVVLEYLNVPQVQHLIRESEFGIFPYIDHRTFQGSGVVIDYLYQGKPVITFDTANFAEIVGTAGVLVPQGDVDRLAAAINAFASNDDILREFTREAERTGSRFDLKRHAEQCLHFFEEVLADQR